ncbi:hypothetical protein SanaruYs_34510 [Chryseotalea sanaruensis]|uniref:Uncharacterized protein n=1 Tax=Chryseotalea sanaruensis TaxID=2482724 RepID=A0A401UE77_9BACT|nr:hypothetical protein [Chryseotalea sanaruensis]GCC53208.1 hypothetical protein SanaruYs_34510 [Chryseotalea sanaruensis]
MKQILPIIIFLICLRSYSQSITNVTSLQQGNNAIISYDLNGISGTSYYVKLSYSVDGGKSFSNELVQVSGDVKSGVKSGIGKKIVWAADKEINSLDGSVIFKVEAESRKPMPKPVTVASSTIEVLKVKRTGDKILIEFTLTQNSEKEIQGYRIRNTSQLTAIDGRQYLATLSKLGPHSITDKGTSGIVECIRGIPVRGELTFEVENEDLVIPAIKIDLYYPGFNQLEIVVKNIPIE